MLRIQHNTSALSVQRHISNAGEKIHLAHQQLSSGKRINYSGDDAAGALISQNLEADIRGNRKALENLQDGLNVLSVADSEFGQLANILQRARELFVQTANDTNSVQNREATGLEITQLGQEWDRIVRASNFNGTPLLHYDADVGGALALQIGSGSSTDDIYDVNGAAFQVDGENLFASNLSGDYFELTGLAAQTDTHTNSQDAIDEIDTGLNYITSKRSIIGAMMNRLESSANNLQTSISNTAQANSRIKDVDVAFMAGELVQEQVKQNSASAMLTQASRQQNDIALRLITG